MNMHYTLIEQTPVDELNVTVYLYEHNATKAKVMHVKNDDPENVFCISLKTPASNSKGTAHILEHTVLCGSKKYPVADPFFNMLRRSMNTFMNAFTGADFTCYPAASKNKSDFYNLLSVYCDAVFAPNLAEESFNQEGHRYSFIDGNLKHEGVVYNEMKGAYNSPDQRLYKKINEVIFPDNHYRYDSGGDPKDVATITHKDLIDFHNDYYHPSRALFYFYGNFDTEKHLAFIHENVLKNVTESKKPIQTKKQPLKNMAGITNSRYPASDNSAPTNGAMVWLTTECDNQMDMLILEIIDHLLMGSDGAPLKSALIDGGYCDQVYSYFDSDSTQIPYCLVLKGCDKAKTKEINSTIRSTLETLYTQSFDKKEIDAAIHQIEIDRKDIDSGRYPYGLKLFWKTGLMYQQGGNYIDGLSFNKTLTMLRSTLSNPQALNDAMKRYLIDNHHQNLILLSPDANLGKEEIDAEIALLKQTQASLTDHEINEIKHKEDALESFQRNKHLNPRTYYPFCQYRTSPFLQKNIFLTKQKRLIYQYILIKHKLMMLPILIFTSPYPQAYTHSSSILKCYVDFWVK